MNKHLNKQQRVMQNKLKRALYRAKKYPHQLTREEIEILRISLAFAKEHQKYLKQKEDINNEND